MKHKIISLSFTGILIAMLLLNSILPAKEVSKSERRKLTQFPTLSWHTIKDGEFIKKYEKYALDQIVFRDYFRTLKTSAGFYLFGLSDQHDIYLQNDHVFKMEYPYRKASVVNMTKKLNSIYEAYLKDMNVYYSVIPDKNYFVRNDDEHLFIDYEDMLNTLNDRVANMKYISLFDILSLDDYYRTDLHWKQESIIKVADKLAATMNPNYNSIDMDYKKTEYYPFYGSYYGQAALPIAPDTLSYLVSETLNNASVFYYDDSVSTPVETEIYDEKNLLGVDSYDVFLSGAKPIVEIYNNNTQADSELIIFRDSFASSLAPLLLDAYSKITLVDLRYISSDMIGDFITFDDQDVLFLYNTSIINNSTMLK
ncbi:MULTISPECIES: DHHW family protein [unclassified Sedimentibacter]|uniref:DHHW family protein n=1 Tax=unclassified Sedimentibacter TaxID=2649220 RepID=UPI0027E0EB0E|nr:DHHW family protein [Sedimentibacter sp. MB35-C1]WMJ77537.1 DHHW family protein [Sedimentibacter sp. MB35-C1]